MANGSLKKVKSIAECSPWSIVQYFWPALSNNLSWNPIFSLLESGRFTQVLLYIQYIKPSLHHTEVLEKQWNMGNVYATNFLKILGKMHARVLKFDLLSCYENTTTLLCTWYWVFGAHCFRSACMCVSICLCVYAGIFLPFWSLGQGPVEFGKISFRPSKLGKLDAFQKNWTTILNWLKTVDKRN